VCTRKASNNYASIKAKTCKLCGNYTLFHQDPLLLLLLFLLHTSFTVADPFSNSGSPHANIPYCTAARNFVGVYACVYAYSKATSGHWGDWLRDQGRRWCFPPSHQWQGTALKGAGTLTWLTGGSGTGAIGPILASLIMGRCTQHRACWRQVECSYLKGEKGFLAMSWWGSLRGL